MNSNSIKRYFLIVVVALGQILFCSGCRESKDTSGQEKEFELDRVYRRGPLTTHVRLGNKEITIADTVLLEFQTAIEPGYDVNMPKVDKLLRNFGIVDWRDFGSRLDANNNTVSRYRYELEPFLSGSFKIPSFTFEFYDVNSPEAESTERGPSREYRLVSEPFDITVNSLLGRQREKLDIADIEGPVEMPEVASLWWLWMVGIAAAGGGLGSWLYIRRRKIEEGLRINKAAHEIAYNRLRELVKQDLIEAGRIKEFYERISDILRHYIEHRFELRAPERTTEEFLFEMQASNVLLPSDKEHLGKFLKHCDLVKFARYNPSNEQIQRSFDLVKEFIEKTRSEERKIDVTEMIEADSDIDKGSA